MSERVRSCESLGGNTSANIADISYYVIRVKAVFSLARRLSPCIIFLDEVDSLFGARSSRGAGGGAQAHRQVLTGEHVCPD